MATVVTNVGKAITTGRLKGVVSGAGAAEPLYLAWGTGAGTAAAADTTLFSETGTRLAGASSQQTTATASDTYQVLGTLTAGGSTTITNAGLFDAATAGNLYMKGDFAGVSLNNGESIQFTMRVQYS